MTNREPLQITSSHLSQTQHIKLSERSERGMDALIFLPVLLLVILLFRETEKI